MRRALRHLFTILLALSLLLAVAIIALWMRGGRGRTEAIVCNWHTSAAERQWRLASFDSSLDLMIKRHPEIGHPLTPNYEYLDWTTPETSKPDPFPFPPLRLQHWQPLTIPYDAKELTVAYWLLLLPTLVLPAVAIARYRRRRRRESNNRCPTCGYDLRADGAGDRCPECGTIPVTTEGMAT